MPRYLKGKQETKRLEMPMKPEIRTSIRLMAATLIAGVLLLSPMLGSEAQAKKAFSTHASCSKTAPYKPAHHCRYDKRNFFRGTFVFHSSIGKVRVKACFRILGSGRLSGTGACARVGPLTFKAYPFKITGVRQKFTVRFTWMTKKAGSKKPFKTVAHNYLKVRP